MNPQTPLHLTFDPEPSKLDPEPSNLDPEETLDSCYQLKAVQAGLKPAYHQLFSLAVEASSSDLEKSSSDLEKSGSNLEKSGSNLEKSGLDLEKSGLDLEKSGLDLEKSGLDLEKSGSNSKTIASVAHSSVPHSHTSPSAAQNPILHQDMHPEADPHSHIHDETSQRRLVNRLSRIEGHIRGVKTMIQEHRPCPEVLVQIAAVRGALDKVARVILDEHLTQCIGRAAKEGDPVTIEEEIEQLRSALNHFL